MSSQNVKQPGSLPNMWQHNPAGLNCLLENSTEIITVYSEEGAILYASPSMKRFLGFSGEELEGRNIFAFVHPEDAAKSKNQFQELRKSDQGRFYAKCRFKRKDGSWITLQSTGRNQLNNPAVRGIILNSHDISKLRRREEKNSLLAAIVESSDDAIFSKSLDGIIQSWNSGAERTYGYTAQEIVGQSVSILIPSGNKQEMDTILKKIRNGISIGHLETERMTKGGKPIRVSLTISPVQDAAGKITGASTIARNISGQKKAEETIQENEEKFRAIFEQAAVGIAQVEPSGKFMKTNQRFCDIVGYTAAELQQLCFQDITLRENLISDRENVDKLLKNEIPVYSTEKRYVRKDKSLVWARTSVSAVHTPEGRAKYTIAVIEDITAQKHAEEEVRNSELQLRALFAAMNDVILVMNDEGRYLRIAPTNPDALYKPPEELIGRTLHEVFPPAQADFFLNNVRDAISTKESKLMEYSLEINGATIWFQGAISPLPDNEVIIVARDITFQKKSQQEIEELNRDLERRVMERTAELSAVNRELEAFSYSVSHDLRAPLRHMSGFVDLLRDHTDEILDDKSKRYLRIISDSSQLMGRLIDDLLIFSRMGRAEMVKKPVDFSALTHEVIEELQEDIASRTISWKVENLPSVHADPPMLRQVMVNLLSNAIKFTSTCQVAEIDIGSTGSKDGKTIFFVRDNGVGFDMKYIDKLFGVFQRLHRNEEFEGTGIGLANVQRIIHRHGGKIWAEAEIDKGAIFYFTIPDSMKGN